MSKESDIYIYIYIYIHIERDLHAHTLFLEEATFRTRKRSAVYVQVGFRVNL